MTTKVSVRGQTVIPESVREAAQIEAGDQLEVGYVAGLVIMRKRNALTPGTVRSLLLAGRDLPEMVPADEALVESVVRRVRSRSGH